MAVRKRKFGKAIYYWYDKRDTKREATSSASWARSRGFKVRITGDYKAGYDLWTNPKR